jgi:hypothetical protein
MWSHDDAEDDESNGDTDATVAMPVVPVASAEEAAGEAVTTEPTSASILKKVLRMQSAHNASSCTLAAPALTELRLATSSASTL